MDYKKRYEDIIAMAKELREANPSDEGINRWIDETFPELAESEDERIRKALIELVKQSAEILNKKNQESMLAWLEKQSSDAYKLGYTEGMRVKTKNELRVGRAEVWKQIEMQDEQKAVIVPKFKIGDKVRLKGSCGWYNVTQIRDSEYYLTANDAVPCLLPICEQDDWEVEQKPVEWSEEDELYLLVCKNALSKYQVSDKWDAGIISRWLENRLNYQRYWIERQ